MRKHIFGTHILLSTSLFCIALFNSAFASSIQQRNDTQKIEEVVKQFWKALGELDAEMMKQTMSFPCTIVEETAGGFPGETRLTIIENALEVDKELMRSNPSGEKRKGEFFNVAPSNLKVQMLNDALAYVSYTIQLHDQGLKTNTKEVSKPFAVLTVLKRDKRLAAWRIVFTNLPK